MILGYSGWCPKQETTGSWASPAPQQLRYHCACDRDCFGLSHFDPYQAVTKPLRFSKFLCGNRLLNFGCLVRKSPTARPSAFVMLLRGRLRCSSWRRCWRMRASFGERCERVCCQLKYPAFNSACSILQLFPSLSILLHPFRILFHSYST